MSIVAGLLPQTQAFLFLADGLYSYWHLKQNRDEYT